MQVDTSEAYPERNCNSAYSSILLEPKSFKWKENVRMDIEYIYKK